MSIPVCIEQMETRWIAYAVDLPGCFYSSEDREASLANLPTAIAAYQNWCAQNGAPVGSPAVDPTAPLEVREIIAEWVSPATGEAVNAFFAADVPPLTQAEVERAALLFEWTRRDLLDSLQSVPAEARRKPVVGEWDIEGIFSHTLRADYLYTRAVVPISDWSEAPQDGLPALLDWTQSLILAALPGLVGQSRVELVNGEFWSPRKFLRRALWHRRDHIDHIAQFRTILQG